MRKLSTRAARAMAGARVTYGAGPGRPRSKSARCDCEIMTLKRAIARGKSSEHSSFCSFYRARAIV